MSESSSRRHEGIEQNPPTTKRRLVHVRELDGVRGIAALIVFFHHVCYTSVPLQGWAGGVLWLSAISRFGYVGVDLFFVLSGFLITSLLIEDRGNPRYYQDFYWKRALRILPLYLICLLGVLLFYPHSGAYVLVSALFIANFAWIFHIASAGPFWTLAIEEQFYLLWPTLVRRRSVGTISRWAAVIGIGAVMLRILAACAGHHNYYFTFFHCDGLAMGAWFACRFERWGRLRSLTRGESFALCGAVMLAIALMVASTFIHGGVVAEAFRGAFEQTVVTLLSGALIALLLVHRERPYLWVFRSGVLTFFGLISYAFYMTHLYLLYIYDHLREPLHAGDVTSYWIRIVSVLAATIIVCLILRYLVELPASRLRKYVLKPQAESPALNEQHR